MIYRQIPFVDKKLQSKFMHRAVLAFFSVVFISLPLVSLAQTTTKSAGIPADWVAFIELTLPADPSLAQEPDMASAGILKLTVEQNEWHIPAPNHSLHPKLWELVKSGQWSIFADPELTRPLNFEAALAYMSRMDTVVTFNPETYEEKVEISGLKAFPFEATWIKVRQVLSYDHATANFHMRTIAIAPCFDSGFTPYWMAVPDAPWENTPNEEDITWAVKYITHATSPGPDRWQEIKNTTGPIIDRLIDRLRGDENITLYEPETGKPVRGKERECLFACTQLIKVFDPQTNTEFQQELYSGIDQQQVTELQLMEEWFWDATAQKLYTRLVAVAPRFWVLDTEKNAPTYPKILFYHKCF